MRIVPAAVLGMVVLAAPGAARSQGDAEQAPVIRDSAEVRRDAERAARRFEQLRLRLLPNVASSTGGPGDIIIGRYRYAAGEADEVRSPPAEPPEIGEARRSLLATLDSASRMAPGDAWLRSRLAWYSIEAGDTTAAI